MTMGIVLILLGLAAVGVVVDFVLENDLAAATAQPVSLFGGTFDLSTPELVLTAAVMGALAVVCVFLGMGLLRGSWGRRRALKRQISDLREENMELRTKANLSNVMESGSEADAAGTR
jgi:hypothetical protein